MTEVSIRIRGELAEEFIEFKKLTGLNKNVHLIRKLLDTYKVASPYYNQKKKHLNTINNIT